MPLFARKQILTENVTEEERFMGVPRAILSLLEKGSCPFQEEIKVNKEIVWCRPGRVCTVEYMPNTLDALRQPVFKGIRDDVEV